MRRVSGVVVSVVTLLSCGFAAAQTDWWVPLTRPDLRAPAKYRIVCLGTVGMGSSEALGINDAGDVVGESNNGLTRCAFIYAGDRMDRLYTPDAGEATATRINSVGLITGAHKGRPCVWRHRKLEYIADVPWIADLSDDGYMVGPGVPWGMAIGSAYLRPPSGVLTPIPNLGGRNGAYAINASHQVVGTSETSINSQIRHAFLWAGGAPTDLAATLPDPHWSWGAAINSRGDVAVGVSGLPGNDGYIWSSGKLRPIRAPGWVETRPTDLNDKGVVVGGGSRQSPADARAFVYSGGRIHDLNDLVPRYSGWWLQRATGINNKGQICGTGWYGDMTLAFRLDPL